MFLQQGTKSSSAGSHPNSRHNTTQSSNMSQPQNIRAIESIFSPKSHNLTNAAFQNEKLKILSAKERFASTQPLLTYDKIEEHESQSVCCDSVFDLLITETGREVGASYADMSDRVDTKSQQKTKIKKIPYQPLKPSLIQKIKADMSAKYSKQSNLNTDFSNKFSTEDFPTKRPVQLEQNLIKTKKEKIENINLKTFDLGLGSFKLNLVDLRDNLKEQDQSLTGSYITSVRATGRGREEELCPEKMILIMEHSFILDPPEIFDEMSGLNFSGPNTVYVFISNANFGRF